MPSSSKDSFYKAWIIGIFRYIFPLPDSDCMRAINQENNKYNASRTLDFPASFIPIIRLTLRCQNKFLSQKSFLY